MMGYFRDLGIERLVDSREVEVLNLNADNEEVCAQCGAVFTHWGGCFCD